MTDEFHDWACPKCLSCVRCGQDMRELLEGPWPPPRGARCTGVREEDHKHSPDEVRSPYVPSWASPLEGRACR